MQLPKQNKPVARPDRRDRREAAVALRKIHAELMQKGALLEKQLYGAFNAMAFWRRVWMAAKLIAGRL